jgi:small conductance mechanosensitive channel
MHDDNRRFAWLTAFDRLGALLVSSGKPILLSALLAASAGAQEPASPEQKGAPIERSAGPEADPAIKDRLDRIFAEIPELANVEARVSEGVVTLTGTTRDQQSAEQARQIAERVVGVVTVQDRTDASVDVGEKISPFVARINTLMDRAVGAAPLVLLAALVFAAIAALGFLAAAWSGLWRRITPNPFVADLVAQAIRVVGVVLGVVIALNLAGATALMTAILGGAGVIGLAVGFAIRDSLENYISSIMLSLRQPFRANDHVVIDGHEGKVVRLTSRATILMTLDGNHLRVPNATVYKAIILNYTRNPERRLQFDLGVDASDDPGSAVSTGTACLQALDFVLKDPAATGTIQAVGDSNIVLTFTAWINQDEADFLKARSEAIRATKMALEEAGFTLPEPIYRLRIDQLPEGAGITTEHNAKPSGPETKPAAEAVGTVASVAPEDHLQEKINAERRETREDDLLDSRRPTE